MSGQHLPADFSKGDANTLGGYMAVHARPAAWEGADGTSYSADIVADETGEPARPIGAYLLFIRWSAGDPSPVGHLESDFLAWGDTEAQAIEALGRIALDEVRRTLDALIASAAKATAQPDRPWWDAMRDDGPES
jgi:hypothetical protein